MLIMVEMVGMIFAEKTNIERQTGGQLYIEKA